MNDAPDPDRATKAVDVYVHGRGVVYGIVVFGIVGGVVFSTVGGVVFGIGGISGLVARVPKRVLPMRTSRFGGRSRISGWVRPTRRRSRAEGGTGQRRLAWLTVDGMVDHLLGRAARQLPLAFRDRFAEEWWDHHSHLRGLRLVWWALCVRATASRTGRELRRPELPRFEGS
jgi:hypothetical protein